MQTNNCKTQKTQFPPLGRAAILTNHYISEIHENDRLVDVDQAIIGLQTACRLLDRHVDGSDDLELHQNVIEGMRSIVDTITYITTMHNSVCAGKSLLEGGLL